MRVSIYINKEDEMIMKRIRESYSLESRSRVYSDALRVYYDMLYSGKTDNVREAGVIRFSELEEYER